MMAIPPASGPSPATSTTPPSKFVLQVEALTGTRFNPDTRQITCLSSEEFYKIQQEWITIARAHAKTCKYRHQNVYLRFFPEESVNKLQSD